MNFGVLWVIQAKSKKEAVNNLARNTYTPGLPWLHMTEIFSNHSENVGNVRKGWRGK